jgi:two-component system sensor histidine kinase UhpB
MGNAFAGKGYYNSALFYYRMGMPMSTVAYIKTDLVDSYNGVATVYKAKGNYDSAVWNAGKVLAEKISKTYPAGMLKAVNTLADIYQLQNNADSSLKYLRMVVSLKDSLFNREKTIAVQNLVFREQEKQKEIETSKIRIQSEYKMYFLVAGLSAILIIAGVLYRNNRLRHVQNVRNRIADDLHDDIGSALSSISIMNELAKSKSPEALSLLDAIGENTVTLQENMSDIVWAIKSGNDHFENVLRRMNQFASEILEAKNIELDFTTDASPSATKLTMEQRKKRQRLLAKTLLITKKKFFIMVNALILLSKECSSIH